TPRRSIWSARRCCPPLGARFGWIVVIVQTGRKSLPHSPGGTPTNRISPGGTPTTVRVPSRSPIVHDPLQNGVDLRGFTVDLVHVCPILVESLKVANMTIGILTRPWTAVGLA